MGRSHRRAQRPDGAVELTDAPVLVCRGCGTVVDPLGASPWACPSRAEGDDVDHVLVVPRPAVEGAGDGVDDGSDNPFVRYRHRLHSQRAATAAGMADDAFVALVADLDARIADVDGAGFRLTPYRSHPELATAVGVAELWAKDETGNVSGSHKARHLMGLALWLRVREEVGVDPPGGDGPRLAISSCGNAALAAATVASALGRTIEVFVPTWANVWVLGRLGELGARVTMCERTPGELGDPCIRSFRTATADGAIPFCCTGPDNGLTVDGGRTIGWELAEQMLDAGGVLDQVHIQVGGGALGTSLVDGLSVGELPAVYAVQAEGCAPFDRALRRVGDHDIAWAARHRSDVMWPWQPEPHSVATGILDDETYDWAGLLAGVRASQGGSVVATEFDLDRALALTHPMTSVDADPTGCAGLAGILRTSPDPHPTRHGIVFTGATRPGAR